MVPAACNAVLVGRLAVRIGPYPALARGAVVTIGEAQPNTARRPVFCNGVLPQLKLVAGPNH